VLLLSFQHASVAAKRGRYTGSILSKIRVKIGKRLTLLSIRSTFSTSLSLRRFLIDLCNKWSQGSLHLVTFRYPRAA
jgi:hypothetical protein